jgi:tRNA A-37 threonylcarbamoyl transferase component Bud32/tetratricopeptide (TPR) repeat protein
VSGRSSSAPVVTGPSGTIVARDGGIHRLEPLGVSSYAPTRVTSGPASTHVPLKGGDVIGERYRVLDQLGSGGMGTVYRVEHTLMAKEMAMKLLRPELSVIPQIVERFEREARSASKLDNGHIVRVIDFGRAPSGALYLVMELLDGEALSARISRGPISVDEALGLVDQILDALEHAHANGVVHRDLKPDNIMLVPRDGRTVLKILDFGLAKMTGPEDERGATLTQAGMVFGTPRYMAPEQAAAEPVDVRTDLYSVGVILFELLTGRPPFTSTNAVELLTAHLTQQPPTLEVPAADPVTLDKLRKIVTRSMAKHKLERFQTATELRDALAACWDPAQPPVTHSRAPRGVSTPRGGVAAPVESPAPDAPRRSVPLAAALALAAVVAVGAMILWGSEGDVSEPTMLERAERALATGDLPAARAILGQLAAKDADAPRTNLLVGHLDFAQGDLDSAVTAYKKALEKDGDVASDPVLAANAKKILEKNQKAGGTLITALALHATSGGAPLLAELAESAPVQRMRSHAFQALERLGETHRLELFEYLSGELDRVRAESCKTRKWYIDRLVALDDPRALPILKRERGRRGGLFNLEDVNGCMADELKSHISKLEKK